LGWRLLDNGQSQETLFFHPVEPFHPTLNSKVVANLNEEKMKRKKGEERRENT
jgi:hypothetical protein